MSLIESLAAVGSLSRLDELRLIGWLAADLSEAEDPISVEEVETEIQDDERVQAAIHAAALRNAVGRLEEGPHRDSEAAALLAKLLEAEKPAS